ncbi:MICAL-like protein 2a isoform X1 [Poecilia formosa]|uniref:Mical-like 2a n=2 Tax=Poecilia formosa TaxID=48698 RepID=A0A087Y2Q3_POEFO|nr:PREDICTED: MICAL-like protein 2 isoform X1 [Poecilia formosa]
MAAIKALEQWCKIQCDGYRDVAVTNMTTSFRNGLAFCALIHKYRPDLIDYDSLKKEDVFENNRLAFQVAEEKLGIPALLDAEDMVALKIPDRLSILTYVSQYYNYFKGRPPIGGVKRPAEGSKEEPSEKKNQPVVAKMLASKSGAENCLPSTVAARKSPKVDGAAAERMVLADNVNKTGTLNSKCVACKSHVHLVQRHFVEGKLYHRSCFKCTECSCVLHTGSYKPGKSPGMFVCNTHQNSSKTCLLNTTGSCYSAVPPNCAAKTLLTPPSVSSVPSAPINALPKSLSPAPNSQSWTASAQKTQAARQRFFQTVPQVAGSSPGNGKPIMSSGDPKVPLSSGDGNEARQTIGKEPGGGNCNNNNKNLFTIRSAESRFCVDPVSKDFPGLRKNKGNQDTAGNRERQTGTSQANNEESQCLKTINKDNTRPTAVHTTAKGPVYQEWQTNLTPVKAEQGLKARQPEHPSLCYTTTTSSNVPISPTRPPTGQTPALPPVALRLSEPVCLKEVNPRKPLPICEGVGLKQGSCSPVKSPLRPPAVESINSTTALDILENPSAAKKGKYLSPNAAFRTEMRSPSWMFHHIPVEQIEKELDDIEMNLVQLEREGVELEKQLRSYEEEGEGDILMDPLMVDWFNLIRKKQMYIRKESELVYLARTQELEQQQPGVEGELRRLLEKPDHLKSRDEQHRERKLLQQLMEIVDGRNAIVEVLDEDRLREVEEDKQLNKMMQDLGVKKSKTKRKSSISKIFKRRSKRRVE